MYRSAGVATTFSPRFLAVLSEARRVSQLFTAPLHLIHAAEESADKEQRFHEAIRRLGLDERTPIHFRTGDPADAILAVQKEASIDVLIAGALERETVHRNFTGNVARELLRRASADLFLFVQPDEHGRDIRHVFLAVPDFGPATRSVFQRAVEFSERAGAESLTAVYVETPFSQAKEKALGAEGPAPKEKLQSLLKESSPRRVRFDYHVVRGNTGFTMCEFIQASEADLLVMPSELQPDGKAVLAPVLDWAIQVIPTNLWVIRERGHTAATAETASAAGTAGTT
ncbi:MAG: universal stress protein [Verrucomicrobia bacterium]|nr:universal stress protein [Verrucomicrobiota bacterium]